MHPFHHLTRLTLSLFFLSFSGASAANDLKASRIGLYPVHLQRFPSAAASAASADGDESSANSALRLMTMPGLQKPHWVPLKAARVDWMGWRLEELLPRPSTVVMLQPLQRYTGVRH